MGEEQASFGTYLNTAIKKIPIQERTIPTENMIIVNGYQINRTLLKQRFSEGKYYCDETPHFLLFRREEAPSTIIVHWFAPEEINADIEHYVTRELKQFGIIVNQHRFGEIVGGIVGSLFPTDVRRSWRYFGANTLQRYLTFLASVYTPPLPDYATMGMFATLYQRICELRVGENFLDAGCASGFLPLLLSERIPFLQKIVGIDIQEDVFAVARELAEERKLTNVHFAYADLLDERFSYVGTFDTVVALHVLEHLSESEMYRALSNLLSVTVKRLIVAVPYEQNEPEIAYGHQQIFSRPKLENVGNWCLQQIAGRGRLWCEDCVGGLLLIEKL